jgi:hypothetical protein
MNLPVESMRDARAWNGAILLIPAFATTTGADVFR